MKQQRKHKKQLTACEIRAMTGIMDEDMIRMILAKGVSRKEIEHACEKHQGVCRTGHTMNRPPTKETLLVQDLIECSHGNDD